MFNLWQAIKQFFQGYTHGQSFSVPAHSFSIDRKNWLRGEGLSFSALKRISDKKMCVLGHYCKSLGIPEEELLGIGNPNHFPPSIQKRFDLENSWLYISQSKVKVYPPMPSNDVYLLLRYNDCPLKEQLKNVPKMKSDKQREKHLKSIFKRNNINVSFFN